MFQQKTITMKKAVFTLALLLAFASQSFAQQDPNAKRILDAMKAKYESFSAFQVVVVQDVLNAQNKVMNSFEGKATVKKNKYKLELADQEIYNNERTIWRYLPDEAEVTIHDNDPEGEEEDLFSSPAKLYQMHKDGFKYQLIGTEKVGNTTCDVIDLAPIDRDKFDFFKVRLYVSKSGKTLKQWTVFEKDPDTMEIVRYRFRTKQFVPNYKVTDKYFSFNVPAGVEIVDMRED